MPRPKAQSLIDDDFSFSSDDDSDAPAEVSTSSVRNKKLSQVRDFRKKDKESKEVEKDKRRKRNEMFKTQKEKKVLKFGKRALPEDVLEAVSTKSSKTNEEKDEGIELNKKQQDGDSEGGDDRLSGDSGEEDDGGNTELTPPLQENFISFNPKSSTNKGLHIVTVEATKNMKTSLEKALAFRNNQLYHNPSVAPQRETAKQRRNTILKKKQLLGK